MPVQLDVTDAAPLADVAQALDVVQIEREMRVNYFGPLAVVRAFAPVLRANGGGAIVNVLSILGRVSRASARSSRRRGRS